MFVNMFRLIYYEIRTRGLIDKSSRPVESVINIILNIYDVITLLYIEDV